MINYFAEKPKSESKRIPLKRRAVALVVAILATTVVYGIFLYSTDDILINQKPSSGLSLDEKQIMWDYVTLNINELSPKKHRSGVDSFTLDSLKYKDASTAVIRYNDEQYYYEAEATFRLDVDEKTQQVTPSITNVLIVREDTKPLE